MSQVFYYFSRQVEASRESALPGLMKASPELGAAQRQQEVIDCIARHSTNRGGRHSDHGDQASQLGKHTRQ